MPTDALPVPWPEQSVAARPYRREYRDALGRPLRGTVTLTGTARTDTGGTVIVPAPFAVELVNGVLEVTLPPDTYQVAAALRTAEGARAVDNDTVTI